MYAAQGILVRASIVLGMVAAVVTILYFTPLPDQYFVNCERPCHHLDWPMICRVKLTIENYRNIKNSPPCDTINCTSVDGEILTVNRQLPGPSIQVCQNDILVVDVINKIPGQSVTIHWRGQPQHEAPTMDGVPMVTQCPISSYTTFQYKFRASSPGTHLWHAHAGSEISDGIFGALIVKQPEKLEPHLRLYDVDDKGNVIIISEWKSSSSSPRSLLINGLPDQVFRVKKGKRYRFRVGYSGSCPATLSLDRHLLKVIALDGNPITPYEVGSVTLSKGERLDFVLKTNQPNDEYILKVDAICSERLSDVRALVKYDGVSGEGKLIENKEKTDLNGAAFSENTRKFNTSFCESKLGLVCIGDVQSLIKIPKQLTKGYVDRKIYLGFDYKIIERDNDTTEYGVYRTNNISFTYPPSPLLTQREEIPFSSICSPTNKPLNCNGADVCECVHVEHIDLDSTVELILFDKGMNAEETTFHLHGYNFYVVGHRVFDKHIDEQTIKKLDEEDKLMKRNLISPAIKDTIRVPKFGAVAVRFLANNPGYWILRDEFSRQWTRGLDVVLQVGDSCDMVAKPSNFPTCGSWIGPDFFLA